MSEGNVQLSEEQAKALALVAEGRNVFLTGSAGTGKSFLLHRVIKTLKEKYGADHVAVCAPTGVAAANIGGQTLNSALGIGVPRRRADFAKRITLGANGRRIALWGALVVDEVFI